MARLQFNNQFFDLRLCLFVHVAPLSWWLDHTENISPYNLLFQRHIRSVGKSISYVTLFCFFYNDTTYFCRKQVLRKFRVFGSLFPPRVHFVLLQMPTLLLQTLPNSNLFNGECSAMQRAIHCRTSHFTFKYRLNQDALAPWNNSGNARG